MYSNVGIWKCSKSMRVQCIPFLACRGAGESYPEYRKKQQGQDDGTIAAAQVGRVGADPASQHKAPTPEAGGKGCDCLPTLQGSRRVLPARAFTRLRLLPAERNMPMGRDVSPIDERQTCMFGMDRLSAEESCH